MDAPSFVQISVIFWYQEVIRGQKDVMKQKAGFSETWSQIISLLRAKNS